VTNKIRHERVHMFLPRDLVAWLRSRPDGVSAAAEKLLARGIAERDYPEMRKRYCRGLDDRDIFLLSRSDIAEIAQDDDIELVFRILHDGSARALSGG
jgi:hypothetical protein